MIAAPLSAITRPMRRLALIAEVAEQERRHQSRDVVVVVNGTILPSTNESAAAISQTDAGAANGKRPRARRGRITSAAAGAANHGVVVGAPDESLSDGDLDRSLDRREHDQHVEPEPAKERHHASHAVNVLQCSAGRLLPG